MTAKNASRLCQMSPGEQTGPWLRTTDFKSGEKREAIKRFLTGLPENYRYGILYRASKIRLITINSQLSRGQLSTLSRPPPPYYLGSDKFTIHKLLSPWGRRSNLESRMQTHSQGGRIIYWVLFRMERLELVKTHPPCGGCSAAPLPGSRGTQGRWDEREVARGCLPLLSEWQDTPALLIGAGKILVLPVSLQGPTCISFRQTDKQRGLLQGTRPHTISQYLNAEE